MKKTIIYILTLTLVIVTAILTFYKNDNSSMDKITVAEVTHSVFYTPWYVAIEKGFFAEENIEIDLILTSGADKVSAALLSNDVQIGFAGPESSIYVYNGGESDYLVSFAGLTNIVKFGYGYCGYFAVVIVIVPLLTVGVYKNRKYLKEHPEQTAVEEKTWNLCEE